MPSTIAEYAASAFPRVTGFFTRRFNNKVHRLEADLRGDDTAENGHAEHVSWR